MPWEKIGEMREFGRVFQYVWPQWPRVVIVVVSAMVIALMLSASFMTIIPLLTVMVSNEGLPSWVDRKACDVYYGLDIQIPQVVTSASEPNAPSAVYLQVVRVRQHGLAENAGFKPEDHIVDVNNLVAGRGVGKITAGALLAKLASPGNRTIGVQVKRDGQTTQLTLATPLNQAAMADLERSPFARLKSRMQFAAVGAASWAVGFLPREQTPNSKIVAVIALMALVTVVTIIRCIAKFYQDYLGQKIVQIAVNDLRENVFAHMMKMPMSAFTGERPSDTISRIVRDTGTMGAGVQVMLGKALREPMNALFMLGAALWLNWQLTLVFLIGAPFVIVALGTFGSRMKKATRRSLVASSQMLAKLQEVATALRIVKVYNQHDHEREAFRAINYRLLKQLLRMSRVDAASQPILEVFGMLAGAGAIVVGMAWVAGNKVEGSEFLALLALLGASAEAVRKTSDIWNRMQQANAASERVFAVVDQPIEEEKPNAIILPPAKGNVEFRQVCFSYPKSQRPILRSVSLSVKAGLNVAIVGPNGAGKTTLINLIPRFYDPSEGQILVDGRDIRDVTLISLRDQIGMVTQDVLTFNDTIAANIAYGRHGATREDIVAAAKRAFAHEFVSRMPEGYETVIGEHGVGLSGGQLQRIVIARAILKNPAILIFDEATSQVDADSEARIHKAIEEVMRGRTTFIIAHRFSTVVAADVIVVMNEGRIIAQGKHDELIQTCPVYQALYETQLVKA
jgi:subfamily B ATP-binding cassette protein MsbA